MIPCIKNLLEYTKIINGSGGKSVLDLGCADGNLTLQIKAWGASKVVGVDISSGMLIHMSLYFFFIILQKVPISCLNTLIIFMHNSFTNFCHN